MIGFIIWSLFGVFIIGLGIKDMFSKNLVGFWANTETIKVKDVKGYNRATGRLFIIYGIVFIILGIPLLEGQNTPYIMWSVKVCREMLYMKRSRRTGLTDSFGLIFSN